VGTPNCANISDFVDPYFCLRSMVVDPGLFWYAVKAGSASLCLWLLALTFSSYLKFAGEPLEQAPPYWKRFVRVARVAFGDFIAHRRMNLWLYVVVYTRRLDWSPRIIWLTCLVSNRLDRDRSSGLDRRRRLEYCGADVGGACWVRIGQVGDECRSALTV